MFDNTMQVISKSMDLYLLRHAVIADNIANAETPGFKSRRVDFEGELSKVSERLKSDNAQMRREANRDLATLSPNVYEDPKAEVGQDRNSVDMDREMAAMTKNDVKYSAASQMISKRFGLLKYAITEGNR